MKKPILKSKRVIEQNGYMKAVEKIYLGKNRDVNIMTLGNQNEEKSVMVLGLTKNKKILFLKEFFYGNEEFNYTFVAGKVEVGDTPKQTAFKELEEETGYGCEKVISLGQTTLDKFMHGRLNYFLALNCEETKHQALEPGEIIEVQECSIEDFEKMIEQGKIICPYTLVAFYKAKTYTKNFTEF